MKYLIFMSLIFLSLLVGCNERVEYVEVLSYDVDVVEPLHFNHKSGETVIKMGKVIEPTDGKGTRLYQYYIEARDGTWIETNQKFHLGDTMILGGVQPISPNGKTTIMFSEIKVNPKRDTLKKRK